MPGMMATPSRSPAVMPASSPATVSWSVMARVERPWVFASCTNSVGDRLPSDAVVWV